MPVEPGRKAPDFTLPDAAGRPVRLSDFRGAPLVLYFYAEDFTPACTDQACGFRDAELARAGVAVVGVSPDPPERHAEFAAEHRLGFALLSDPTRKVLRKYGAFGEKTLYGKKVQGVIRSTFLLDAEGRVAVAMRNVRAKGHVDRVVEAARRLGWLPEAAGRKR